MAGNTTRTTLVQRHNSLLLFLPAIAMARGLTPGVAASIYATLNASSLFTRFAVPIVAAVAAAPPRNFLRDSLRIDSSSGDRRFYRTVTVRE